MKKDPLVYAQLQNVDIRVGHVLNASVVEGSSKLIELTVDLGADYGTVTIFTGMQKWYTPEDFQGKKFAFVANLEPKPMMGKLSQGMILAADFEGKPFLLPLPDVLCAGSAII